MSKPSHTIRQWEYWIPFVTLCIGIFIASSFSRPPSVDLEFEMQDKVLHFFAYAGLGCALQFALFGRGFIRPKVFIPIVFFTCALYGASDEFHQYFVPGRSLDFFDWVADALGGLASTAFYKPVFAATNWYRQYRLRNSQ